MWCNSMYIAFVALRFILGRFNYSLEIPRSTVTTDCKSDDCLSEANDRLKCWVVTML
jgi:hypothetical protein